MLLDKRDLPKTLDSASLSSTWPARLHLELAHNERGTRLVRNRHCGPLYVQKPFYPEGRETAHIYLLHPPGGLVSGDCLDIHIGLGSQSHSLITTPGAARMYRARDGESAQKQQVELNVGENALLEWFPMESIVYNGADAHLETVVNLQNSSHFMAWEMSCFGLPASRESFISGNFNQRYIINQDQKPVFVDQVRYFPGCAPIENAWFHSAAGMQGQIVSGFLIAGPFELEQSQKNVLTEKLRAILYKLKQQEQIVVSWNRKFCIARYLGQSAYTARSAFTELWKVMRPSLVNKEACEPRIWLT